MSWLKPRIVGGLLTVIAAFPLCASLAPETGAFLFQNYSPKTYGANPQNWSAVQDSRGVMYFGNTYGVLEFDGVFWRLIRLTNDAPALSLAIDARGRVYVGGQGVIGYLDANAQGRTEFIPIAVPKTEASFLDVRSVVPTSAGVYFGTRYAIFFYSDSGQIKVWHAKEKFGRIFAAYGELFATTTNQGLRRLEKDDFVAGPSADTELSHGNAFFAPGERPLVASVHGLYEFTLSEILPFANGAADYFRQHSVSAILQLSSGDVAVGTKDGGLVLLNRSGALERIIQKENGLISDQINAIYEDRRHGLWVVTEGGLSRFALDLSIFREAQGLKGSVLSERRFAGDLYVATSLGAFRLRTAAGAEPVFEPIQGLDERLFFVAEHAGELFAGGDHGLYLITGDKAKKLPDADGVIYDMCSSTHHPEIFYTAGLGGIRIWRQVGRSWKSAEPVGLKGQQFRTVLEDTDGTVWSTTQLAIWHFDFSKEEAVSQNFTTADGVPAGFKTPYPFRGHVVFATPKGLMRFSEKDGRIVRDDELGASYGNGSRAVSIVREDNSGNVWITGAGYQELFEKTPDGFNLFTSPFIPVGADELFTLLLDPDGSAWASDAAGALLRLQKLNLKDQRRALPSLLRRVAVIGQQDSLFEGDSAAPQLSLQHKDNALRFEFAAPYFDGPPLEYQFQLDGNEKKWSDWTKETYKEYTNLFEGAYRFHVRVRDPHGTVGSEVVFPFRVFPPFYRTWWAYATYVGLLLLAGWLILRWRLDALQAKNRWLEGVVEERTAEVRKERDQNEELLLNILPRPVAAELRSNGSVKPTTFDDATVCFSDFVGFTLSSEKLPAETLINALNEYFTAFDEIIGRYGLEKLKTIGDAYMFAGGLPNLRPSHAVDAVLAALEMAAAVNRLTRPDKGVNWKIRLGLYSGPVVSGVVGVRKFAFDIWGNTVNFAARMESAGSPGRVNLSETTCQRVGEFIQCEARGPVKIKEGREMEMFFAVGPKPELLQGPLIDGVPEAFRKAYENAFGEPPKSFPVSALPSDLQ